MMGPWLKRHRLLIAVIGCLLLSACASHQPAPVISATSNPLYRAKGNPKASVHNVSRGETLYSIAWHYSKDVQELIRLNGLKQPYTIYPGQRLKLQSIPVRKVKPVVKPPTKVASANKSATKSRNTRSSSVSKNSQTKTESSKKVVNQGVVQTPKNGYRENSRQKNDAAKQPKKTAVPATIRWQWPTQGKVIARFSAGEQGNQGIDIIGPRGSTIRAAAQGEVVYAGAALRGFGHLLIIKHNDDYLSAYAHNDRLLVKEKDVVKAGQPIAQMGSSGTDRVKLHFEIRHRGQPVDPGRYLPKQS